MAIRPGVARISCLSIRSTYGGELFSLISNKVSFMHACKHAASALGNRVIWKKVQSRRFFYWIAGFWPCKRDRCLIDEKMAEWCKVADAWWCAMTGQLRYIYIVIDWILILICGAVTRITERGVKLYKQPLTFHAIYHLICGWAFFLSLLAGFAASHHVVIIWSTPLRLKTRTRASSF